EQFTAESVGPIAASATAEDARLRAALVSAMLMGIVSERHLLGVSDLAAADVEDVLRLAVPVLRGLIAPGEGVGAACPPPRRSRTRPNTSTGRSPRMGREM
ncbi:hypothetical protein, partial [Escherichia coli]|uniref:TetR/AcrR family transcriptional regulator n=1 Tax=Escherichia coli TaxID=562 RepID=UPI003BA1A02C